MPQFSILMANYNNAPFIDAAILSVLNQTFSDWELVIVDDASRDDSVDRIGKYLNDPRIRLYRKERNEGYTKALIFGLTKVSSGIVGFLDSDDALTMDAIERAHTVHSQNPQVGLVLSQLIYCNEQLVSIEATVTRPEHRQVPLVWMTGPNHFRSFKMTAYNKTAGLDVRFKHAEDWDLVFKLEEVAPTFRIDEPLYRYRILDTSASHAPQTYMVGIRSNAHALYDAYQRRGRARSDIPRPFLLARSVTAVRLSIYLNEPAQAALFAFRALRIAPFQPSSWKAISQSIQAALRLRAARRAAPTSSRVASLGTEAGEDMVLRSFGVSDLHSNTGNIEPNCIVCIPLLHKKGHCIYGGDFLISEEGAYRAVFELDINPYSFADDPLVILDIYENFSARVILAESLIGVADLRNQARTFHLDFIARKGYRVEFRVFWREQSFLKAHGVILKKLKSAASAAMSGHDQHTASERLRALATAKVSAIIPCYNGARWLSEAIDSIKAQTQGVDEIIVVDDASTDGSYEIAREHGDVIVLRNTRNSGEGYSRNVGLRHATGDLITWLDADDLWWPHHVRTLMALLERYPEATAAFAAVQRFGLRNDLIRGDVPPGEPSNVFWLAFRDWVHTTIGSMTRRSALLRIGGFDEHERYSVDFDLWLRLSRSHLFVCTYEVTSQWRWHNEQQSAHQADQIAALHRFRRRYWERERATGDPSFAAEIEARMIDLWREEIKTAWDQGDASQLRFLYGLASLLPKPPSDLPEWTIRARAAAVVPRENA
jgi:glycosyltransferase involved in cell wall biosynthesis